MAQALEAAMTQLAGFSGTSLCELLWALAELGHEPGQPFMDR